ncbi:sugar ABC transporter substrate-binding protein [Microbacterium ulmi]
MLATGLAACGGGGGAGGEGDPENAALVMTIWGSENDTKTYQERADAYTADHPGVTVKVRNIPVENYDQQVDTMIAGGSSPDIILVDGSKTPGLASRGGILDLSPLIDEDGLVLSDTVDPGRVSGYQVDGKQYAVPDRGGNIVFYYNKTMFQSAGVPEPKAGWTWDEMVDAAEKTTIRDGGTTTQWGVSIDNWPNAVQSVTASFGASMFNDAVDAAAVDSPEYREALTEYNGLATDLKVSPTLQDYADFGQNVNRDALFAQGKTAMIWAGLWNIPEFVKQGIDFGIVPPPVAKQGEPTMMAFGTGLAVGARSKNQAAAWEVVRYMFTPDGQRPIVTNGQDVPSANELIPEWEAGLPGGISYAEVASVPEQIFSTVNPPQINEILKQWEQDLYPFFTSTESVDDATSLAAQHINGILGDD